LRDYFQGLFLAPHVVGEALKGAVFTAAVLEEAGFSTDPGWDSPRTDIIQQIRFGNPEALIAFCRGIQAASPIDAHLRPEPAPMPGYDDPVIMAAGTFVQGASIELSADGPLRPPYVGFMQGGLTYAHVKIGILTALDHILDVRNGG
jgi:cystathionine beta-lyase family protein involved in aluminum resistance